MTVEVVDFGGRKPSKEGDEKALADARSCLPAHDPFQQVFDFLDRITSRIETAVQGIGAHSTSATPLNDDQVKSLTYATERAAERGVGIYATRIRSWHQAIVGGAFVAGVTIGIMGTFYLTPGNATDKSLSCQDQDGGTVCWKWTRPAIPSAKH